MAAILFDLTILAFGIVFGLMVCLVVSALVQHYMQRVRFESAMRHRALGGDVEQLALELDDMLGGLVSVENSEAFNTITLTGSRRSVRYDRHSFEDNAILGAAIHLLIGRTTNRNAVADERAWRLLNDNLTREQQEQLASCGSFRVRGGQTGMIYEIHRRLRNFNVFVWLHGQQVERLCFGPVGTTHMGDIMLAQKIALESYESEALGVANRETLRHYGYGDDEPEVQYVRFQDARTLGDPNAPRDLPDPNIRACPGDST